MDNILLLLSLFALLKSLLMTSLLPNRWYRLAFSLLLGAFVAACHPYAMDINKLRLQQFLSSQSAMMDISLVVMVDLLLSGYFCMARIKDRSDSRPFRWYTTLFRHLPSLLVFPALFYIQITLFFSWTGTAFGTISGVLAGGVVLLFGAASFFMRRLVPEKDLLIELVAMLSLLICALVICCTIFHPASVTLHSAGPVDWKGCALTLGGLFLLFLVGFAWSVALRAYKQLKNKKHQSH